MYDDVVCDILHDINVNESMLCIRHVLRLNQQHDVDVNVSMLCIRHVLRPHQQHDVAV